jgi:serine/threonine-protein kinase RsbW
VTSQSFPRSLASVPRLLDFVEAFFGTAGLETEHLFEVQLGLEELFTNVVKYGGGGTADVVVEMETKGDDLRVRLVADGVDRFDPSQAPDADVSLPLEGRRPGGLGLHLVKRLVDRIDYDYDGEARTGRTTLIKRVR